MQRRLSDKQYGDECEKNIYKFLCTKFKELKYTNEYDRFDFYTHKGRTMFELKARRITKIQYATTLIGYDKIQYVNKLKKTKKYKDYNFYLLFLFTDGLYFINCDGLKYDVREFNRTDRGYDKRKAYAYIKTSDLKRYRSYDKYLKELNETDTEEDTEEEKE